MNFFTTYSSTPILGVILLFCVLVVIYIKSYKYPTFDSPIRKIAGGLLILILCLYAVQDTDYFHYIEALSDFRRGYNRHFEDIYVYIAEFVEYDNFLFRLCIWGTALACFYKTISVLKIPTGVVLFFFCSFFLLRFSYARVSVAMAIGLLGYTYLISSKNVFSTLNFWGLTLIIFSLFCHKSALFWIPIFLISLFPLNKKRMFFLILIYPILIYGLNYYINDFLSIDSEETAMQSMQSYMSAKKKAVGISQIIRLTLIRVPYYLPLLIIVHSVFKGYYQHSSTIHQQIYNVCFYILYFSSTFLFVSGVNANVIHYRLLYYALLPLSLLFALYRIKGIYKSGILLVSTFGILGSLYELLYSYYTASLLEIYR